MRLEEGKRAFGRGDTRAAVEGISEANRVLRSRKLSLVLGLLRLAPGLLLRAYTWRERRMLRAGVRG
jgi:hypothetical protein